LDAGHLGVFTDRRGWIDVIRVSDKKAVDSTDSDRGLVRFGRNLRVRVDPNESYGIVLSYMEGAAA
jgi:hypothetical protein